nr:MFS transporter [Amycolatopsis sp. SID8362]
MAVGTDAWVVAGFLPALARDMAVPVSAAGWSVTVFALAYVVGAPVLAAATSTRSPRRVIAAALTVLGLANVLCAISAGFGMFLTGRVIAALAASLVTPVAGVLSARVAGERHRGRALALVVSGLTLATAIGVPLGSVVADIVSWRGALLVVGVLAWVAAVTIRLTAPDPGPGGAQTVRDRLAPLARPRVLAVLGLTIVGMAAAYVPYAYAARLLPEHSGGWLAVLLMAYGVGAVAGSVCTGVLTDRIGPRRTLTVAYALMAAAFAAIAARPPVVGWTKDRRRVSAVLHFDGTHQPARGRVQLAAIAAAAGRRGGHAHRKIRNRLNHWPLDCGVSLLHRGRRRRGLHHRPRRFEGVAIYAPAQFQCGRHAFPAAPAPRHFCEAEQRECMCRASRGLTPSAGGGLQVAECR